VKSKIKFRITQGAPFTFCFVKAASALIPCEAPPRFFAPLENYGGVTEPKRVARNAKIQIKYKGEKMEYIGIGLVLLIIVLAVVSTVRFNRKKPMTREEFEAYEKEKKEWKEQ